jgi:hypothetical protein
MVTNLEVKEITQRAQQLLLFRLQPVQDESQRGLPLNLVGVAVTSGPEVYQPTMRLTVKRKLDDPVAFAMIRKVIPPYPDNTARAGAVYEYLGRRYTISGGILYVDNEPYWSRQWRFWPTGYSYSPTAPPTGWDPLGEASAGIPFYWNAFDLQDGETGFLLSAVESYWPAGSYFGWVEYWPQGDGTVPDDPPELVVPFVLKINRRPQTTLAV